MESIHTQIYHDITLVLPIIQRTIFCPKSSRTISKETETFFRMLLSRFIYGVKAYKLNLADTSTDQILKALIDKTLIICDKMYCVVGEVEGWGILFANPENVHKYLPTLEHILRVIKKFLEERN